MQARPIASILFILIILGIFALNNVCLAKEETPWPLKKSEVENILDIIRKNPLTQTQRDFFYQAILENKDFARKAGAVILVKQAILKKQANYWFSELPQSFSKAFLKNVFQLVQIIYGADLGQAIKMIEQLTVEKAAQYALDWLLQNQVKIGSGELSLSFLSYQNNQQSIALPYIIIYQANNSGRNLISEFYSKEAVEPPSNRSSLMCPANTMDWGNSFCWPWDIWLNNEQRRDNDGLLEPFIVRIKAKLIKNSWGNFTFDPIIKPIVEIEFDKPIPQIDQSDIVWQSEKEMKWYFFLEEIFQPGTGKIAKTIDDVLNFIAKAKQEGIDILKDWLGLSQSQQAQLAFPFEQISSGDNSLKINGNNWEEAVENFLKNQEEAGEFLPSQPLALEPEPPQDQPAQSELNDLIEQFDQISEQAEIIIAQAQALLAQQTGRQEPTLLVDEEPSPEQSEPIIILTDFQEPDSPPESPASEQAASASEEGSGQAGQTSSNYTGNPSRLTQPEPGPSFCNLADIGYPTANQIIFNEIAWMGGESSSNDEWFELKNISNNIVNLENWQVLDENQQIKIILPDFNLSPGQLFLLERTDDNTLPFITANVIYTGALNNTNEGLYLFDSACLLQDKVQALPDWPAGESQTKQTMIRCAGLSWQTSQQAGGSPGQANQCAIGYPNINNQESSTSTPNQSSTSSDGAPYSTTSSATGPAEQTEPAAASQAAAKPGQIVIVEAQIGQVISSSNDFIRLFNQTTTTLDISNFQLKKKSSSGQEYSLRLFPGNTFLAGREYFTWANSQYDKTKPIFLLANTTSSQTLAKNNSIALFNKEKEILDQLAWGTSSQPFVEAIPFSANPAEDELLVRKWQSEQAIFQDTNHNQNDFYLKKQDEPPGEPPAEPPAPAPPEPALAKVHNLIAAPSLERLAIDLFWLSPATNTLRYLVKYAQKPIVESPAGPQEISWQEAAFINQAIVPQAQGELERLSLTNLEPDQTYYFSLKIVFQDRATSGLSNLAKAKAWPGFQENPNQTITDLQTGLLWPKLPLNLQTNSGQEYSWQEAKQLADNLVLCQDSQFAVLGEPAAASTSSSATTSQAASTNPSQNCPALYDDWRLPGVEEMAFLLSPSWPGQLEPRQYWTNSFYHVSGIGCAGGWCAYPPKTTVQITDFEQFLMSYKNQLNTKSSFLAVRALPEAQASLPKFNLEGQGPLTCSLACLDNNDQTITDPCSNLMWIKGGTRILLGSTPVIGGSPWPKKIDWLKGFKTCSQLVLCQDSALKQAAASSEEVCADNSGVKYDDWRLPNFLEAFSGLQNNENCHDIYPWESGYHHPYWTGTLINQGRQAVVIEEIVNLYTASFNLDWEMHLQCVRALE